MSHERLLYLAHLIDRVNREVDVIAILNYSNYSSIHITNFHGNETSSQMFDEHEGDNARYDDITFGDKDLVKAEAFLLDMLRTETSGAKS
jgi:hypothetical protein